jgi:23S rRNA pseudouridine1911/1915/1917 synthase
MIVLKNKHFVVINKPCGMPSQSDPSGDKDAMTLTSEILRENGENPTLFLIHRLDRVVGGLMVFARSKEAASVLSTAVAERSMTKEYFAVIPGKPEGGVMVDYIFKDASLGKAFVTDRKRNGVKDARLEYSVCRTITTDKGEISLVRVMLGTGRFHQIRCQFASRKMPLIGDKKYGSRDFLAKTPSLFASHLSFEYRGEVVDTFALPDLAKYPWSLFSEEDYIV